MKNKLYINCFLIIFSWFTAFDLWSQDIPESEQKEIEVVLGIDNVQKLDFAPSTKIQVGNESILTYQLIPQKREITFKGLKPGKTSVIIRNNVGDIKARYIVNITASSHSKVIQELREFLVDVEGIEIGMIGETVYLGGKIVVPEDIGKILIMLEKYEDTGILNLVELSPHTQRVIARKMQEEIQKGGMPNVTVRIVNRLFWLEGVVNAPGKKQRAMDIATAYLPDKIQSLAQKSKALQTIAKPIIQDFITVNEKKKPPPKPKMIKITSQFVELTRDYNRIFGFKWTPLMSGSGGTIAWGKTVSGGVTTKSNGTLSGTISNLFPKLASAKSAGHARIIQSGVVVVKENVQATLVKSAVKPFAIGTGEFTKAQKATSGYNMSVTPQVLGQERVNLKVKVNVSSTSGDPPEELKNEISTELVVKSKESAVVGGVVVNKNVTDFDRNPPGGTTTVEGGSSLFSFLRSKSYQSNKSQFVVFITPELIDSASVGTEEIKRKFRRRRR